ncbi:MAG: T9SS type A sorting domain-containing protein [Bacteroidetes bacterium]|nr:T9SS type A sorting domain-containing protein [Bacteroidota bacterium]
MKPNPTKGYFEIINIEYKGNLTVKITDIFGNIIFLKEYEQNDKAHFDLSSFSNGLYILEIDAENQNLFFKIVKQ